MKKFTLTASMLSAIVIGLVAQTTIYTQNFSSASLPAGWQNVDQAGNGAGTWTRKTSAHSFASTSASNGFYIFDADLLGNDNKPENADLISGAINCSANAHVALQFEQYFQQYQAATGTVFVSTNGTNWTQVYSVNNTSPNPEVVTVDLTPYAANQATVYIKFNYSGDYDYWWAVDDIKLFEPAPLDIAVSTLNVPKYAGLSNEFISGVVTNKGFNTITSFDLAYSSNGGAQVSQSFTGLNIGAFQTYAFQFTTPLAMTTPQKYAVDVVAIAPNGGTDADATNNTKSADIIALSAIPDKNVLMEEFTTTPCGWCPDGHVVAQQIKDLHSYFIPENIHAGFQTDAMTTTEASAYASAFADGAPTACIDRVLWQGEERVGVSRNTWQDRVEEREAEITPATVSATSSFNASTREVTVNVTAKFYGAVSGTFRLNAHLVEDSVTGTGSGYNQSNYLNTQAGHPMQGRGNPIVGYVHRHVFRKALGGTWGATGVVPATTANNGEYSTTFTYTIPAANNAERCEIIAFVHEYNSSSSSGKNEVLNVVALPLNGSATQNATPAVYSSISDNQSALSSVSVFPNPANDIVNINVKVGADSKFAFEVYNMIGQGVYSVAPAEFTKGSSMLQLNTSSYENGVYFIAVKENGKTVSTQRFVINH